MFKKIILRGIWGFPLGLAIGYSQTIIISLGLADGYYVPCAPGLVQMMGSEIGAVLLQAFLMGLLGFWCAAGSVLWEVETWGIAKQTGIYFLFICVPMMLFAYIAYWMEHSLSGILRYFGIFVCIYAVIWLIQYAIIRHHIKKMNAILHRQQNN